jgi:hypothetical protein
MDSLRLVRVLELERAVLPRRLTGAAQVDFIQAAQRCLQCRSKNLCDEVVRERAAVCLRHFCPNSRYIESLRAA